MNKMWQSVVVLSAVFVGFAAVPRQRAQLDNVMREKLVQAQKILESVVTSDWASLETHTQELEQLTNDPRWMVLRYPESARQSAAFVRAIQDLRLAAVKRDLEKTPQAYVEVILKCVECHRYMARARIA